MSDSNNAERCKTVFHFALPQKSKVEVDGNWLEFAGDYCAQKFHRFYRNDIPVMLINMDQAACVEVVYE